LSAVFEAGGVYLDALAAADFEADGLQVVAHVMADQGSAAVLVRTVVPGDDPSLASAGAVWAGATWHEREITDLFGITFTGSLDDRPLLTDRDGEPPLLKSSRLDERYESEWPGGFDPADKPGAKRRTPLGFEDAP
jgi:NADH-quinone oxidoreductase subunit C